jgi:hypothetical protein
MFLKNVNTLVKNVNKTLNSVQVAKILITYLEIMNAIALKNISIQVQNANLLWNVILNVQNVKLDQITVLFAHRKLKRIITPLYVMNALQKQIGLLNKKNVLVNLSFILKSF